MKSKTSKPSPARVARRRRYASILLAATLGLAGALIPTSSAQADDGPFDVTGTIPDSGATELPDVYGNTKELGPKNASSTKIGVIHNAPLPMLDNTNPNAQVDLRRAWLDGARDPDNQHDWIYFAWERDSNSGSGFISFEFMKNAAPTACNYVTKTAAQLTAACNPWKNRADGDFMILWDQSGSNKTLYLRQWSGTAPNLTLSAPVALDTDESAAQFSPDGFKGEAAIDITAALYAGVPQCLSFANVIPGTVTGNSDSADYKDTILTNAAPFGGCDSTTVTTPKLADGTSNIPSSFVLGASGNTVRDSAVVDVDTGTPTPSGSVAFSICKVDAPGLCTTGGTSIGSTALSGSSYPVTVLSPTTTVTQPGRYCFRAEFSGDSTQGIGASSDSSSGECFTVDPVASSISTNQSWVPNDSATVSAPAGGALAGSVTFTLYPTANCTGTAVLTPETVSVAGASPQTVSTSNTTAITAGGSFSWKVSYSSTNGSQRSIANSCQETSTLSLSNGVPVSSS